MKTALIATLAILGSTTAALAAPGQRHETVDVRPVVKETVRTTVSVEPVRTNLRPVIQQPVVVDRHRDRGHGPVVHQPEPRPVIVTHPVITHPIVINQPVYTPPVYAPPVYSPPIYQPSTLSLANDVQLYGAQFINIDRTLQKLTLSAETGRTDIQAIQITFANGDIKTFNYNELLDRSNPQLTLNLGGRNVDNIVVFGHAQSWGAQMDVTAGC